MKTKLLIGKTLLATLILLAVSIPFMTSASAPNINAIPTTDVYMSPFRVEGTAGSTVRVDLRVQNVVNLFAFQAGLTFNPVMVNITAAGISEGGFLSANGADNVLGNKGAVNNTAGTIGPSGWTLTDPLLAKSGGGILIHFDFKMKVTGFSDVHIVSVKLVLDDGSTLIPANTWDYFTAEVGGNQYTVKVVGNPYGRYAPPPPPGFSAYNFAVVDKTLAGKVYHGELNFSVTGYGINDDMFGYFNVTIPKSLMNCTIDGDWRVDVDNNLQSRTVTDLNATHTVVSLEFTYTGAEQTISIASTNAVPEFSTIFLATLLVLATFGAAILGKSTLKPKRKS